MLGVLSPCVFLLLQPRMQPNCLPDIPPPKCRWQSSKGKHGRQGVQGYAIAVKRVESYTLTCGDVANTANRYFIQALVRKVYPLLIATCWF